MRRLRFEYAVRNLGRSPTRLALSVLGSVLVVMLVITAAAFVRGIETSLIGSGSEKNIMLLGVGSEESIERSEITPAAPSMVTAGVPGIKTRLGIPYVSPEVHMAMMFADQAGSEADMRAVVRGVTPSAFLVHDQVRITAGRAPEQGKDEIMVGQLTAARMGLPSERLGVGNAIWFDNRPWNIVGNFTAPGTVMDAEIWCPVNDLLIAAKRDSYSCIVLTLDSGELADVEEFAATRLDLELAVMPESQYYSKLIEFYKPVRWMIWITAVLIATGGMFGGLNTMYAAFSARFREIGMLQSLGYSRRAIVLSFMQESLLISAIGALIGSALSLVLLDGIAIRINLGAFGLVLDTATITTGLLAGLFLGLFGAVPAAARCLRLPITEALKAS
ncbi:MAG: ABC transporter permease [Planctomycetota bacterium]|jgi:putative ABC transport system permease protein